MSQIIFQCGKKKKKKSDILVEVKENMLLHGNCEESKPKDF